MRVSHSLVTSTVAAVATATNLFVSSYAGTISTLSLRSEAIGGYSLTITGVNTVPGTSPSWLTKDELNGVIYSTDEGLTSPNGSVSAYSILKAGEVNLIGRTSTVNGPVSSVVYNCGKALALAHYGGSAVTTWSILFNGTLHPLQTLPFKLTNPGPNSSRQDAPHPHQVIVDPTDTFIIVPDLGADLLRIFSINITSSSLIELPPFATPAGSGPRHGTFLKTKYGKTFFFLISELANTITSYEVKYEDSGLEFEEVFVSGTYGPESKTPVGAAAAELILSPDKRFLLTSSRNATLFQIPNFSPKNRTKIPSDTLQSWSIDDRTGTLSFAQLAPAGGRFPRQFSVNRAGTLAAVGLQSDGRVVVLRRGVKSGRFGEFVASVDVEGEVTSVVWDE